ncbi:hypothetical protein TNIN_24071 [Trichonephila inaurata madagascariensis]|uniref:Uncharacterized protein n=1 Tax=Trichonephila inaurata madagascariensis TaxID=2747483 RepID=A0A8X7CLB5_9ARAC|nr:hypothetical protein TNIN_24071 [Trichonephila inaurata madagascariensis]
MPIIKTPTPGREEKRPLAANSPGVIGGWTGKRDSGFQENVFWFPAKWTAYLCGKHHFPIGYQLPFASVNEECMGYTSPGIGSEEDVFPWDVFVQQWISLLDITLLCASLMRRSITFVSDSYNSEREDDLQIHVFPEIQSGFVEIQGEFQQR